ncbi:MAG: hypothetical protein FJ218_00860 [Ignavibacteria bacterium]|nr:hypothetical protein [Ignavibacteria bacterium]
MKKILAVLFTATLLNFLRSEAQTITVCAFSSYTNEAKFYPSIPFDDATFRTFENIVGFGIDARKNFIDKNFIAGITIEHLVLEKKYSLSSYTIRDGFTIVPIEFSSYFSIPISSEKFFWNVGGGVGVYWGKRNFSVNDFPSVRSSSIGIGIHVTNSVEYFFTEMIGVRSEIKFRDAQFEAINTFSTSPSSDFPAGKYISDIHVDGITLSSGFVVRW